MVIEQIFPTEFANGDFYFSSFNFSSQYNKFILTHTNVGHLFKDLHISRFDIYFKSGFINFEYAVVDEQNILDFHYALVAYSKNDKSKYVKNVLMKFPASEVTLISFEEYTKQFISLIKLIETY